jgi:hypothetical protein
MYFSWFDYNVYVMFPGVPIVIAVAGGVVLATTGLVVYSKWHKKRTTNQKNREWTDILYEEGSAGRSLQQVSY